MAIKCHSGFVHYNMYHDRHCHGGGNNFGSIFNITNNCSGGTSFWGGFGAGLGLGFGSLFGGLLGGFMGGFGMGGLGFGGFGGFGGLGGWANGLAGLWGGGNNAGDRDYSEYASRRSRRSSSCDCGCKGKDKDVKDLEDPDNKKIIDLRDKIRANDVTKAQLEGYIKELGDLKSKGLTDNYKHDKDVEELGIDALLAEADAKLKKLGKPSTVAGGAGADVVADDEITVDGKPVKIAGITLEQVEKLTPEAINALDAKKAVAVLKELGYINADGVGKMSSNYKVLLLLQKSGVNVQCATNPNSKDQWIQGKISNVALTDGKLSWTIDNSTADGDFKFKYSFKQVDDKDGKKCFHLTKIEKNGSTKTGYVESNWKQKDYVFEGEKSPLKTSGNPLVSHHNTNGRTKLEDVLE